MRSSSMLLCFAVPAMIAAIGMNKVNDQLFFSTSLANKGDSPVFTQKLVDDKVAIGYGIALGDVDGDGKPDILLADKKDVAWYRNGDWKKFIMATGLSVRDNVCIAARDMDGDGKVEVAVGAQWNPGETSNELESGAIHFMQRPADPTQRWTSIQLKHEPTVHRMRWAVSEDGKGYLLVLPLHGRGNKDGQGNGVKFIAYEFMPGSKDWPMELIDENMHMTHNLDIVEGERSQVYVAGKEGIRMFMGGTDPMIISDRPAGEVRVGKDWIAAIEPMHGNKLSILERHEHKKRYEVDDQMSEGHAIAIGQFMGKGKEQVIAGWRVPNKDGKVGIKIHCYNNGQWESFWIDQNGMACEDIQVMDLDADGKLDIVASGRATGNLKIYYNRN